MSLKGFFVKEDADKEAKDYKKKNTPPEKTVVSSKIEPISNSSNSSISSATASSGIESSNGKAEFMKYFNEQLANTPPIGHYLEFVNAMKEVENVATDEKTKFQMIFAPFKAQKVTVQNLIDAGKKYQEILEQKKAALENGYKQGIAQRDQSISSLNEENKSIDQQMQSLNSKKLKNSESIKAAMDEKTKLDGKKADFTSAHAEVNTSIQVNIDKISQFLEATTTTTAGK